MTTEDTGKSKIFTTVQRDDLKPCPFCGTKAVEQGARPAGGFSTTWRIMCGNPFCVMTCCTKWNAIAQAAVEAWEGRAVINYAQVGRMDG